MVRIVKTGLLSNIRGQQTYDVFPDDEFREIRSALSAVPPDLSRETSSGTEIKQLDAAVADGLRGYEHEHDSENGRNSACKLWMNEGFNHSVDLYHPEKRIAIEIEKSERKRLSDDV
jgi:hypothetical protein